MKLKILSETIQNSIKQYRFRSVFVHNLIIYISSITLPIILMNFLIFTMFSNQISLDREKSGTVSLARLSDNIVSALDEAQDISYMLSIDYYIQEFMSRNDLTTNETTRQSLHISSLISGFINSNDYIDSIMIFSEKQNFIYGNRTSNIMKDYYDITWYDDYVRNKGNLHTWMTHRRIKQVDIPSSSEVPVITRFFIIQTSSLDYGLIAVNINPEYFAKKEYIGDNGIFIFDKDGILCCQKGKLSDKQKKELTNVFANLSTPGISSKIIIAGTEYYIFKDTTYNHYFVLSPSTDAAIKQKLIFVAAASVLISLIIVLLLSVTLGRKTLQPLEKIIAFLKEHNLNQNGSLALTESEIDYIIDSMTKTFSINQDLKTELSANLLSLQQYQIMALQSQINPHFLYNTLNTINLAAMELTGGENEASQMLENLSELFRLAFANSNYLISLSDELEYLNKYISLQKKRWPHKFDVEFNIGSSLSELQVFKFSLQPIVENAISHGIKPLSGKGKIIVCALRESDCLKITITDNGIGIPREKLKEIKSDLAKENNTIGGNHIGLSNVNSRIKLMFGNKYGLGIDSVENSFTRVTYTLPIIEKS